MMIYYDSSGNTHPLTQYSDHHIKHVLNGEDEMSFTLPTNCNEYQCISEETKIIYGDNEWLVKKIDDDKFDCVINFDSLRANVHLNLKIATKTLAYVLSQYLPAGWSVYNANVSTVSRTIELEYATDYDVIYACMKTYSVYFAWKTKSKELYVFSQDSAGLPNSGEYIAKDLNLKSLSFKGETTDFATRIYAYGKDGMTLEDAVVNGARYGLQYIDNNNYSSKIISYVWKDERYTDPDSLYQDAQELLNQKAAPVRSYECTVDDLAKQNPTFAFLTFKMHYKAILLNHERKTREEHKVVEYDEYPDTPSKNVVTLSTVSGSIQDNIDDVSNKMNDSFEKQDATFNGKIASVTSYLMSVYGTYKFVDANGNIYFADSSNLDTAQSVWLFNSNGIGHSSTGKNGPYTTSLTANDELVTSIINAIVIRGEYIEAGSISAEKINQNYTDDVIEQAVEISDGHIESAIANSETSLRTLISQTSDSIELTVESLNQQLQQSQSNISKHFEFRQDGLTIKTGSGKEMQLSLDNGLIRFSVDGVQFGHWDGVNFHTGNIYIDVDKMARFGNIAIIPRTNGNMSFIKIGGDS